MMEEKSPTKYQINEAEDRYRFYVKQYGKFFNGYFWNLWHKNIKEERDYVYNITDYGDNGPNRQLYYIPDPFCEHKYNNGEIIPWRTIAAWAQKEISCINELYDDYVKYASERKIIIRESQFVINNNTEILALLNEKDIRVEELSDYIDKTAEIDRKEKAERQSRIEHEELIQREKLAEFIKERQPLYINVRYEEKEKFKKYGCRWDPELKKWYATEMTWRFKYMPQLFFNRMEPEDVEKAIEAGLLSINELSKQARVNLKMYQKKK